MQAKFKMRLSTELNEKEIHLSLLYCGVIEVSAWIMMFIFDSLLIFLIFNIILFVYLSIYFIKSFFPRKAQKQLDQLYGVIDPELLHFYKQYYDLDIKKDIRQDGKDLKYEREFPMNLGIEFPDSENMRISARVVITPEMISNRIILKKDKKQSLINCIHTIITIPIEKVESNEKLRDLVYHEGKEIQTKFEIKPWEHFTSLCSFVQGISEYGIINLIEDYISPENENKIHINDELFKQLINAIDEINANLGDFLISRILETYLDKKDIKKWFNAKYSYLQETYSLGKRMERNKDIEGIVQELRDIPAI